MSIPAAALLLDLMERNIELLIQSGKLVAFNIALTRSVSISCVRVLTLSISDFQRGETNSLTQDDAAIAKAIIPFFTPALAGTHIAWLLHCSPTHVVRLIEEKHLAEVGHRASVVNQSPKIATGSLIKFLTGRRIK